MGGDICVFLSYASEDQSLAEKVKRRLEQEGWEIFFAHPDIKTGSFPSKIDQELKRATHFIPLLTNYSITKPWVTSEIDAALCLKNAGTLEIVPIVIGLEVERIRPLLGSLNSFRIDNDLSGIASLVDAVSGFTPFPFHVLPPRPWCCVGRDSVVRRLVENLCGDHPDPAIIYGPPAIGKTTVCLEVLHAEQVRQIYGDRRVFLQLDDVETVDELVSSIVPAIGLSIRGKDWKQWLEPAVRKLRGKGKETAYLIILDSIQDVYHNDRRNTEDVLNCLGQAAPSTFLASVMGREWPAAGEPEEICRLEEADLRDLFHKIAGSKFDRDRNLDELIKTADGFPSVLELLARQAQPLPTLEDVMTWWQSEGPFQTSDPRQKLHSALRRAVAQAQARSPRINLILQLLGILPAGISTEHFSAILGDSSFEYRHALLASGLASYYSANKRYTSPAPYRNFFTTELAAQASNLTAETQYYVDLAIRSGQVGRSNWRSFAQQVMDEAINIETILIRRIRSEYRPTQGIRASIEFGRFQRIAGVGTTTLLEAAARKAHALSDRALEAECRRVLAAIKLMRSDAEGSSSDLDLAMDLYKMMESSSSQRLGIAHCERGIGEVKRFLEDHKEAHDHFLSALRFYETEGDNSHESVRGKAICIQRLGDTAHYYLDHDVAKSKYEQALPLFRRVQDLIGEASCYKGLADIARTDRLQSSRDKYETAKKLFEEIPYWLGAADCYYSLGDLALSEGQFREATRSYDQAAQRYAAISSQHGLANCKYSRADILLVTVVMCDGDQQQAIDEAKKLYKDALRRYRLLKDRVGIANSLQGLSDVALLGGKYEERNNLQQNASRELPDQFRSGRRDCHLDLPNPLSGRWRI